MDVGDLRKVLEDLSRVLAAAKAGPASREVADLLALFDGRDAQPVDSFLKELEARLAEPPAVRYVRLLREAGIDRASFSAVFAEMVADKAVDKDAAEKIAFDYIGYAGGRSSWPNKKAAFQAIAEWFKHVAFETIKTERVDRARYAS